MPTRPGFRIIDLVVAVAALGVALGGGIGIRDAYGPDIGSIAFWLVFAGVVVVGYLTARFARTREVRLIVVGIALAFAAAADQLYSDIHIKPGPNGGGGLVGLTAAAVLLVLGGVAHGLMTRWNELRAGQVPPPASTVEPDRTPSA